MRITWMFGVGLVLAAGCDRSTAASADGPKPAAAATAPAAAASLDSRTPLPLTAMMAAHQKQQMRDHLRVIQEVTAALATDDYDAISASAARIGWTDQQATMCQHMGAGAPGFAQLGEDFHRTADGIIAAAHDHDHARVVAALDATLQKCVGCHETYRQDIVADDAAPAAPMAPGGGDTPADCPMHGQ